MNRVQKMIRPCSALLATGAGVAVCLGGDAYGAFQMGNIAGSNGGKTTFVRNDQIQAFDGKAQWYFAAMGTSKIRFSFALGNGRLNRSGTTIIGHAAGVTINSAMAGGFEDVCKVPAGVSDKYFAVQFTPSSGVTRYGWLHVVSTNAAQTSITIDKWGYEDTNSSCLTLAESITTRSLPTAGNKVLLHWANENEEGVARYEVQLKEASGAWRTVSTDMPGAAHYAFQADSGKEYRLVIENATGERQEKAF